MWEHFVRARVNLIVPTTEKDAKVDNEITVPFQKKCGGNRQYQISHCAVGLIQLFFA